CFFPTAITTGNISQTGLDISWTAPASTGVTGYDYEIRTSGLPGSGATGLASSGTVTGTSANVTGLSPSTTYSIYVRTLCGGGTSRWTPVPETFSTLCGIVTGNFFEGFETTAIGTTTSNTF